MVTLEELNDSHSIEEFTEILKYVFFALLNKQYCSLMILGNKRAPPPPYYTPATPWMTMLTLSRVSNFRSGGGGIDKTNKPNTIVEYHITAYLVTRLGLNVILKTWLVDLLPWAPLSLPNKVRTAAD